MGRATGPLPYCDDLHLSKADMDRAVAKVFASGQFEDAWDQLGDVMLAVQSELGCQIEKPPSSSETALKEAATLATTEPAVRALYDNPDVRKSPVVLQALARNQHCPADVLRTLASKRGDVRFAVASNPRTPPDVLRWVRRDKSVHGALASNPSTPPDVLAMLSTQETGFTKHDVALNPSTPTDVLVTLSQDTNDFVVFGVIENPSTPQDLLVTISQDARRNVRDFAQAVLRRRN